MIDCAQVLVAGQENTTVQQCCFSENDGVVNFCIRQNTSPPCLVGNLFDEFFSDRKIKQGTESNLRT